MGDLEHINIKTELVSDSEDVSDNSDDLNPEMNILQQPFQGPFTNFTIEEILKPEFGSKKRRNEINHRIEHDSILRVSLKRHSARTKDENSPQHSSPGSSSESEGRPLPLPAWVYCTRYSDRPSSGPRSRKLKKKTKCADDKRPRTAFSNEQLHLLKDEFEKCQYLTEQRRKTLARDLKLSEGQIKIWFQNKRAKVKKTSGVRNILALHLMAQGLYNHSSMSMDGMTEDMMDDSV